MREKEMTFHPVIHSSPHDDPMSSGSLQSPVAGDINRRRQKSCLDHQQWYTTLRNLKGEEVKWEEDEMRTPELDGSLHLLSLQTFDWYWGNEEDQKNQKISGKSDGQMLEERVLNAHLLSSASSPSWWSSPLVERGSHQERKEMVNIERVDDGVVYWSMLLFRMKKGETNRRGEDEHISNTTQDKSRERNGNNNSSQGERGTIMMDHDHQYEDHQEPHTHTNEPHDDHSDWSSSFRFPFDRFFSLFVSSSL